MLHHAYTPALTLLLALAATARPISVIRELLPLRPSIETFLQPRGPKGKGLERPDIDIKLFRDKVGTIHEHWGLVMHCKKCGEYKRVDSQPYEWVVIEGVAGQGKLPKSFDLNKKLVIERRYMTRDWSYNHRAQELHYNDIATVPIYFTDWKSFVDQYYVGPDGETNGGSDISLDVLPTQAGGNCADAVTKVLEDMITRKLLAPEGAQEYERIKNLDYKRLSEQTWGALAAKGGVYAGDAAEGSVRSLSPGSNRSSPLTSQASEGGKGSPNVGVGVSASGRASPTSEKSGQSGHGHVGRSRSTSPNATHGGK